MYMEISAERMQHIRGLEYHDKMIDKFWGESFSIKTLPRAVYHSFMYG